MSDISQKFMRRMFRRINGVVWDLVSGGMALQTEHGLVSFDFDAEGNGQTSVNPFDSVAISVPAFAVQKPFSEVELGDLVCNDAGLGGWVVEKTAAALKLMDHNSYVKTYSPPRVQIMGNSGVLCVTNLFNLTGGAAGAANLAPLLLMGGDDTKLEKILPLLLMGGMGGSAPAAGAASAAGANPMANPMLMMMLMKDGGLGGLGGGSGGSSMDKLLPLMMMGGMGGGAGGMNPMMMLALMGDGDLFGGKSSKSAGPALVPTRGGIPVLNRED